MSLRHTSRFLVGATALLALGASVAFAQDSTRARTRRTTSSRRIPISKEAPGEVARRVDTVTVYRTDTLRLSPQTQYVHDTVTVTNTVTRVDTVTVNPVRTIRMPSGLYFGLGGGVSAPNGSIYNPNNAGPSAQAQLGWQGLKNLLGIRGDVNYAKPGEDSRWSGFQADPEVLNFNADAKLQLPWFHHIYGLTPRFAIYGIGGYTHTMYKNLPIRVDAGGDCTTQPGICVNHGVGSWTNENGWNAGGGASLMWGRTELFLESRVLAFSASNIPQARQIPIVLGINWY
jgi:hypothetical protein